MHFFFSIVALCVWTICYVQIATHTDTEQQESKHLHSALLACEGKNGAASALTHLPDRIRCLCLNPDDPMSTGTGGGQQHRSNYPHVPITWQVELHADHRRQLRRSAHARARCCWPGIIFWRKLQLDSSEYEWQTPNGQQLIFPRQ